MGWTKEKKRAERAAATLVRKTNLKAPSCTLPLPGASLVNPGVLPTEPPTLEQAMCDAERARTALEDLRGRMMVEGANAVLLGHRVFLPGEWVIVKANWWPIICPPLRSGHEPRIKFSLNKWDVRREVWSVIAAQGVHKGKPFYTDIPAAALEHA